MTDVALYLIATPISSADDLSLRSRKLLTEAKFVIGEEFRPLTTLLKSLGRERKPTNDDLDVLNEHSQADDVQRLVERIRSVQSAGGFSALISDCGTPGFCDPGAALVRELRKRGLKVSAVPGASSLMCILSASGLDLREFVFRGFPPAEREERERELQALAREPRPQVLMDTPYRMLRLLEDLDRVVPDRTITLGCDLTALEEEYLVGVASDLKKQIEAGPTDRHKREFILILSASTGPSSSRSIGSSSAGSSMTARPNPRQQERSAKHPRGPGNAHRVPKRR